MNASGDVYNIILIINKEFEEYAAKVFNPRNAMFISKNDGMMNNAVNHSRDTIINLNTFLNLSRDNYNRETLDKIRSLKQV